MIGTKRAGRVGLGISASVIAQAIQAVQAFVMVPFFIRAWGVDGYGRWTTLSVLASYLALLDLGGQSYVANLITIEYSRQNFDAFRARLSEALSFFVALGVGVFGILTLGLAVACRTVLPFLGRELAVSEAWVLDLLAAYTLVLAVPGGLYVTLYRAVGKYARGAMMGNAFRGIGILAGIACLLAGSSPEAYAAVNLVIGFLLTLALVWDSRRLVPELQGLTLGWRAARNGAGLVRGSVPFLLMGMAQSTAQQLLMTLLAVFRSPTEVGIFATHRTLASIPNYIGPLVQAPLLPEMSALWGEQRRDELFRIAMMSVRTVVFLTGAAAMAVWVAGPIAFRVWTGRSIEMHPVLLALLLLQGILSAAWSTCTWGPLAANHHGMIARLYLGAWALTVGSAAFFLVPRWGMTGAAASVLVGDMTFKVVWLPFAAASFYEAPRGVVFRNALRGCLHLIPLALLAIGTKILAGGTLQTLACLALMGLLAFPMMVLAMRDQRTTAQPQTVPGLERPHS